jgi:excisionase family DNA binding protein
MQEPALVYDLDELSAVLKASKSTLRRWLRSGRLPFVQPGGPGTKVLVPREAVTLWLRQKAGIGTEVK